MYIYEIFFSTTVWRRYFVKQGLINKKSCSFEEIHLILHSLGLCDEDRRGSCAVSFPPPPLLLLLVLSTSVSSSTSVYILIPPAHLPPPLPMWSCRGVAAESFAGAAGTVSRAFIFGSSVLTLSNPCLFPRAVASFAKSVITMRPVRSTFTLIYPKRGAVA